MKIFADIMTALVAAEHLLILWIEMFAWESAGKKTFKSIPADLFKPTRMLAANQGLYNGFLAAGLLWSFLIADSACSYSVRLFFLSCVIVAGVFGALTASRKIFFVQAVPAIIAVLLVLLAGF